MKNIYKIQFVINPDTPEVSLFEVESVDGNYTCTMPELLHLFNNNSKINNWDYNNKPLYIKA